MTSNTPQEVSKILGKKLPFAETLESFKPQTEKHEKALENIKLLVSLIDKFGGQPPKPIMFALHGKPGTGKTHLLKAFLNEIAIKNIPYKYISNPGLSDFFRKQEQIIAIDDLYSDKQNIDELNKYDYERLKQMLFDIYSNKKIFIFTSNFSLAQLIAFIKKFDTIGRISSRINEFVGICPDMEMDGEDFRLKIKDEINDIFGEFFK